MENLSQTVKILRESQSPLNRVNGSHPIQGLDRQFDQPYRRNPLLIGSMVLT